MANRFSAGAFIVALSFLLIAPPAAQARSGGFGGGHGGGFRGGFHRAPAVHIRPAARISFGAKAIKT